MGLSHSQNVYKEPDSPTDDMQMVDKGCRGRLYSVWVHPDGTNTAVVPSDCTVTIRDGDSSGTVIMVLEYDGQSLYYLGTGPGPMNIPENGILFSDGLNLEGIGSGLTSASVTYTGMSPS